MTLDLVIENLHNNIYNCSKSAQENDIKLICKFLRYKYNNEELLSISHKLIREIEKRNGNPLSWLTDD